MRKVIISINSEINQKKEMKAVYDNLKQAYILINKSTKLVKNLEVGDKFKEMVYDLASQCSETMGRFK